MQFKDTRHLLAALQSWHKSPMEVLLVPGLDEQQQMLVLAEVCNWDGDNKGRLVLESFESRVSRLANALQALV